MVCSIIKLIDATFVCFFPFDATDQGRACPINNEDQPGLALNWLNWVFFFIFIFVCLF